ncbi:MAG TPA: hypothetical protein VGP47_08525 [Parachlamydiaceae bacterium]|nr:hypothetical protein [Parachlamydiaceae bacterium]
MDFSFNKINIQGKLWTIPGPFLICCILLTIVLRSSATPLILPITAVGGLVACLVWKWRGVAVSSVFLAGILVYCLQMHPSQSWIWIIALSLSIASSFVVAVLCSEEAYHDWEVLKKDSIDHKQTLSHLNERYHTAQNKLVAEQIELNNQITQLQQQLNAKEEKQRSNEQLIKLARHEMTETFAKQEKMLQELLQARQKSAAMEARIGELEELVDPEIAKNYGKSVVQSLENELDLSKKQSIQLKLQMDEIRQKEQNASMQFEAVMKELAATRQVHESAQIKNRETENELSKQVHEYNLRIETIEREKQDLKKALLQLQEEWEKAAMLELEKSAQFEKELVNALTAQAAMEENELKLKTQIEQYKLSLGTSQASFKENEHLFLQQIAELQSTLSAIQEVSEENEAKLQEQIEAHHLSLNKVQAATEENEIKYIREIEQHQLVINKIQHDFQSNEAKLNEQIAQLQSALSSVQNSYHETELKFKEQMEEKESTLNLHKALHEETEGELKEHVKSLENLHKNYEDQNEKIRELEKQLESGASEAEKLQSQYAALMQDNATLIHDSALIKQQHSEAKENENELKQNNEQLIQRSLQLDKLREEHQLLEQKLAATIDLQNEHHQQHLVNLDLHNEAIALLRKEKEALVAQLQQLQQLQLQQVQLKPPAAVEVVQDNKEARRIEGLYQQLRQQFAEKSATLSATRKELFTTQEKLLALQKDREEEAIDDSSETTESLHRLIAAAESELALLEHQHTLEINRLHDVIDSLMAHA